jgi:hypothetical protein
MNLALPKLGNSKAKQSKLIINKNLAISKQNKCSYFKKSHKRNKLGYIKPRQYRSETNWFYFKTNWLYQKYGKVK